MAEKMEELILIDAESNTEYKLSVSVEDAKKARSKTEKLFIVHQVAENKEILENKKTDGTTIQAKNAVWENIRKSFCSQGFTPKSTKQLKKCWDNIKQKSRQQNTILRQNQLLTGGGPLTPEETNVVTDVAQATIPNIDVELENKWDSTAVYEKKVTTATLDGNGSSNSLHEEDSDIDVYETASTSKASCSTRLLERGNTEAINKASPKNNKRVLKSRNDNVLHVTSKKICNCNDMLLELQVEKVKHNIEQQKELHEQRMKVATAETKLAVLRVLAKQEINDKSTK
ncbi:PREDICTED: myb/SANT-like DNA-binding domain-containing protein 3 [Trachymyrmex cornetzi]|uniref:myb/SANT-like DNA-binding domain-containing protein 3 n=1 Tax=Trachymyrmex cornetzi TaxID=471704 RepID=UPI00084F6E78|nr:PREDICTED: myb/SANT-like DNA-binding domain-containing protein 3 [Trachymyrmex cornetzi]